MASSNGTLDVNPKSWIDLALAKSCGYATISTACLVSRGRLLILSSEYTNSIRMAIIHTNQNGRYSHGFLYPSPAAKYSQYLTQSTSSVSTIYQSISLPTVLTLYAWCTALGERLACTIASAKLSTYTNPALAWPPSMYGKTPSRMASHTSTTKSLLPGPDWRCYNKGSDYHIGRADHSNWKTLTRCFPDQFFCHDLGFFHCYQMYKQHVLLYGKSVFCKGFDSSTSFAILGYPYTSVVLT